MGEQRSHGSPRDRGHRRRRVARDDDDFGAFGWLRGVQERAIMLEIRRKDGSITARGYSWLQGADFEPSTGITLNFSGEKITIAGRNLNAEARPNVRLFAGIVRAHLAARELDVKLIVGCRLTFMDGSPDLLCYPKNRAAYGRLCRLLTVGKSDRVFKQKEANGASASWPPLRRPSRDKIQKLEFLKLDGRVEPGHDKMEEDAPEIPKGECHLRLEDFLAFSEGQIVAVAPPDDAFRTPAKTESFQRRVQDLAAHLKSRVYLAATHRFLGDEAKRLHRLAALAGAARVPLIATNDVLYHGPERRALQDVMTCIRETCTI